MASILKYNKAQHTNGTDALTIDSVGRILTPNRPAFGVSTSTTQNISTSWSKVTWSTVDWNVGNHWSTTNNNWTAPIDGIYHFNCLVRVTASSGTMEIIQLALGVNGANRTRDFLQLQTANNQLQNSHVGGAMDYKLDAGDTIQLNIIGSGSSPTVGSSSRVYNWFCGHLIG